MHKILNSPQKQFWFYLILAMVVIQLPIISIPFKWLESYFHELSHGLAALVTGGQILSIQLFPNGAGLCTTAGGSRVVTAFMGYAGATIWGVVLYRAATLGQKQSHIILSLLVGLIGLSIILWVRDLLTIILLVMLIALAFMALKINSHKFSQGLLKLIGLMVLLNSLLSPTYLLDGRSIGDGATLANILLIPEIIWVVIWFSFALISAYFLSKKS